VRRYLAYACIVCKRVWTMALVIGRPCSMCSRSSHVGRPLIIRLAHPSHGASTCNSRQQAHALNVKACMGPGGSISTSSRKGGFMACCRVPGNDWQRTDRHAADWWHIHVHSALCSVRRAKPARQVATLFAPAHCCTTATMPCLLGHASSLLVHNPVLFAPLVRTPTPRGKHLGAPVRPSAQRPARPPLPASPASPVW
jgi:hypothetical protein